MMNEETESETPPAQKKVFHSPSVKYGEPDLVVKLGNYSVILFSSGNLQNLGMVRYHHVVAVCDDRLNELLYVAAEWNPMGGPREIFLGTFTGEMHSTVLTSPLLASEVVFLLAAFKLVRNKLGFSNRQTPITEAENQSISMLVELVNTVQPNWKADEGSVRLLDLIIDSVKAEHPGLRQRLYQEPPGKLARLFKWGR